MGKQNGKRYHFLYRTTNLIDKKYYVGIHSTYNLEDGYLGSGKRLKRAIKKYGIENFKCEILEFFESREEVLKKEEELVNEKFLQDPMCMNLQPGGGGGLCSEEHRIKFQEAGRKSLKKSRKNILKLEELKKDKDSEWYKNFKEKLSNSKKGNTAWAGKTHTKKTKKLMSDKAKLRVGKKNSQFGTCWIRNEKESIKIKKEDLQTYLSNGWIKGRKIN